MFQDPGIVATKNKDLIVNKGNVRRQKRKIVKKIQEEEDLEGRKIASILFYRRKN